VITCSRGRSNRCTGNRCLTDGIILEIPKVEQLVLDDRAADRRSQAVVVVAGKRRESLSPEQRVVRIQIPILEIFVDGAMDSIGAGFYDRIAHAAGGAAEFGAELVLEHRDLSYCAVWIDCQIADNVVI